MTLQVLIPTYKKTINEIVELFDFWKIESDCIVSNQCGYDDVVFKEYKGFRIKIICSNTIGVSVNRNILMDALDSDVGVFIDDDCCLMHGYEKIILKEFEQYNADYILFNGYTDTGSIINLSKKNVLCKRYRDVSHIGGPGIAFTKKCYLSRKIQFNEKLGTPNYIYMGEDSFFAYQLIKSKMRIIKSNALVYKVVNDIVNSSYFKGYTEQYFASKGAINKLVHPYSYSFWRFYYLFILKKKTQKDYMFIFKNLKKGEKLIYLEFFAKSG